MGERKIEKLDGVGVQELDSKGSSPTEASLQETSAKDGIPSAASNVKQGPQKTPAPVFLNYPEPTTIAAVLQDIAVWSGRHFILEPSCNKRIQIFSAKPMTPREAYQVFLHALSTVSLRAVEIGQVTKIVPIQTGVMA